MADREMNFSIVGMSPLLTHNPASMGSQKDATPKKGGKKIPTPEEEAEAGLYVQDGKFCFPGIGIRNSIIKAAADWGPLSGKKRGTLAQSVVHLVLKEEMVPILEPGGKPVKNYVIDTRRAVVQRQGIKRSRPRFESWRIDFTLVYDDVALGQNEIEVRGILENVINDAGKRIGLGDYRPSCKGWFGRFSINQDGKGRK